MKVQFRHKRIVSALIPASRSRNGPPPELYLHTWSRSEGRFLGSHYKLKPFPRGGYTLCQIIDDTGNVVADGEAWCSMSDAFCYKTGRTLAEDRARKALALLKP